MHHRRNHCRNQSTYHTESLLSRRKVLSVCCCRGQELAFAAKRSNTSEEPQKMKLRSSLRMKFEHEKRSKKAPQPQARCFTLRKRQLPQRAQHSRKILTTVNISARMTKQTQGCKPRYHSVLLSTVGARPCPLDLKQKQSLKGSRFRC